MKYTNEQIAEKKNGIITYLQRFPFKKWAAESVGINRDTVNDWEEKDEEFSARVKSAIAEGVLNLGKKASPDMLLASVDPETFGRKDRLDITSGGKPIPIYGGKSTDE